MRLPDDLAPTPVTDFRYFIDGNKVRLTWDIDPTVTGDPVKEIRLYRSKTDLASFCEGCPLRYQPLARLEAEATVYTDVIESGYYYAYQIQTFDVEQNISPRQTVQFTFNTGYTE